MEQDTFTIPNYKSTGHDGLPWPDTFDAAVWATEFCKLNTASDWGTMVGWFANAIMIGYDTANQQKSEHKETQNEEVA